ncbi:PKD domain-containing protein [Candidatus Poribacteria bacterium]|nr:PKD domain-containing protein [Candidatus Poribacteria bacterium]
MRNRFQSVRIPFFSLLIGFLLTGFVIGCSEEEPFVENQLPLIRSLRAEPSVLSADQTATITVSTADPDFDVLQFTWKAADGELRGEGASVVWVPPEKAGTYTITLLVSDGNGGTVSGKVDILVEEKIPDNLPPVIQSIKATPDVIRPTGKCLILVSAFDPDGDQLVYTWSYTQGEMKDNGREVTWTAPLPVGGC